MRTLAILLFVFNLWGFLPYPGNSQHVSLNNFAIHSGVEYPWIKWNLQIGNPPQDRDDFTVRPHFQLNCHLPLTTYFQPVVFAGFSNLGYTETINRGENWKAERHKDKLTIQAISVGIKGLFNISSFAIGPMFNLVKIIKSNRKFSEQINNEWRIIRNNSFDRFIPQGGFELGYTIQRSFWDQLILSLEGVYWSGDIFTGEEHLGYYPTGDIIIKPRHYRVSIGYRF